MSYPDRNEIAKRIAGCFKKKAPSKEKLYLFADELLKELSPKPYDTGGGKTIPAHSSYQWGMMLQAFGDSEGERAWKHKNEILKFIKKIEKFQSDYNKLVDLITYNPRQFLQYTWLRYHEEHGDLMILENGNYRMTPAYDEDDNRILIFPDKMELMHEYLMELHKMLHLELTVYPKKIGRPTDTRHQAYLKNLYVMTECLLEVRAGVSHSATPFSRIVDYCMSLMDDSIAGNFPYIMAFCSEDYETIRSMAYIYKKYGRLDLFIEHILKTEHAASFSEEFEDEWATWEKPSNFNKLNCCKNP